MNENLKINIAGLINYGWYDEAHKLIKFYHSQNPDDADIIPFAAALEEKASAIAAAMSEPVDPRFYELMELISPCSEEEIFEIILQNYNNATQEFKDALVYFLDMMRGAGLWGDLEPKNSVYGDFRLRAKMLKAHRGDLLRLHERLADNRSKNVLYAVLSNWIENKYDAVEMYRERAFKEYFDPIVFPRRDDEVFVDIGAFVGDTALDFINYTRGEFKHMYCYEVSPANFQKLDANLSNAKNISLRNKGAWSSPGNLPIAAGSMHGLESSSCKISAEGAIYMETVRIDDDIPEPVTFIKMDIEGAEREALIGCRRQISENRPRLAICTYHGYDDIYAVPRLIDEIAPGYEFFMRYNGGGFAMATEFTLLAK